MAAGLINIVLLIYLIKNKKKSLYIKQIIMGVILGILYLPWIIYFSSQLITMHNNGFWITLSLSSVGEILGFPFTGYLESMRVGITYENINLSIKIGVVIAICVYGVLIYSIVKNGLKESKPAVYAGLIYILIIIVALLISLILHAVILYFRYVTILMGLMLFAIAFMFSKHKKSYFLYGYLIVTIIFGILSNVIMIKDNYDSSNKEPFAYLEEKLQEGDVFVYPQIGSGSVIANRFPEYKQYFYNEGNWGVEEAYKAIGSSMETHVTKDFFEELHGRVWILISEGQDRFYEENFKNENYRLIEEKRFLTAYKDYEYKFFLVEKIENE